MVKLAIQGFPKMQRTCQNEFCTVRQKCSKFGLRISRKFWAEAQNLKTGNGSCNLGKGEYFYMKVDILRIPNNFTDPRFDFSRISYDFSKLGEMLPRFVPALYYEFWGNKVKNKCFKGKIVISGQNISQDMFCRLINAILSLQDKRNHNPNVNVPTSPTKVRMRTVTLALMLII